jgi:phage baseplate assembly protein W
MAKSPIYKDLDLNFTRHPITNDVSIYQNIESVKKSVSNLLKYKRGEKLFNPDFYTGVYDSMFEPMNILQVDKLKEAIKNLLNKYETRILVNDVSIKQNLDSNEINVYLYFTVINVQTPVSYTVKLLRNR